MLCFLRGGGLFGLARVRHLVFMACVGFLGRRGAPESRSSVKEMVRRNFGCAIIVLRSQAADRCNYCNLHATRIMSFHAAFTLFWPHGFICDLAWSLSKLSTRVRMVIGRFGFRRFALPFRLRCSRHGASSGVYSWLGLST